MNARELAEEYADEHELPYDFVEGAVWWAQHIAERFAEIDQTETSELAQVSATIELVHELKRGA
jgi:hypothetical protein